MGAMSYRTMRDMAAILLLNLSTEIIWPWPGLQVMQGIGLALT